MQNEPLLKQLNMELDQLRRREWQFEKLGDSQAVCAYCSRDADGHLEKHHPIGQANDPDFKVWACVACHLSLTDRQYDWPDGLLQEKDKSVDELFSATCFALADGIELRFMIGVEQEVFGADPAEVVKACRAAGLSYLNAPNNESNGWSWIGVLILLGFLWYSFKPISIRGVK